METFRDVVIIVFSVTGTTMSIVLLIICFKLYGRASRALEQIGIASNDLHEAAEAVRGGVCRAKGALEVVTSVLPSPGWAKMAYRAGNAFPRVARFIFRIKKPPASRPK